MSTLNLKKITQFDFDTKQRSYFGNQLNLSIRQFDLKFN